VSLRVAVYRVAVHRGANGPVEAEHRVTAIAHVPDGGPEAGAAPVAPACPEDFVTFFRSSCKPFQLLPLVERGHADRFGFGPRQLAVMAASHSGAAAHVEAVRGILAAIGLDESALGCGFHFPQDPENEARLRCGRAEHSPVYNNCSGKHAGMLALAVAEGWAVEDYTDLEHPVQRACVAGVAAVCDVDAATLPLGVDGCSAANPALWLSAMARGFSRFARARAGADAADDRERALACIRSAMAAHPDLVAGEGRLDTELMTVGRGALVSKGGAEGLQCLALPASGAGVALKVHDGAHRAVGPATLAFLVQEGWLFAEEVGALARWAWPIVRNHRGLEVGEVRILAGTDASPAPAPGPAERGKAP
jgi:L-asparaginase II